MNLQDPLRSQNHLWLRNGSQDLAPPEALISLRAKSLCLWPVDHSGHGKMGKSWENHGKINDDRIFVEERLVNFPICGSLGTIVKIEVMRAGGLWQIFLSFSNVIRLKRWTHGPLQSMDGQGRATLGAGWGWSLDRWRLWRGHTGKHSKNLLCEAFKELTYVSPIHNSLDIDLDPFHPSWNFLLYYSILGLDTNEAISEGPTSQPPRLCCLAQLA